MIGFDSYSKSQKLYWVKQFIFGAYADWKIALNYFCAITNFFYNQILILMLLMRQNYPSTTLNHCKCGEK